MPIFEPISRGNISRLEYSCYKYFEQSLENVELKSNFNTVPSKMKIGRIHPDLYFSKVGYQQEAIFINGCVYHGW